MSLGLVGRKVGMTRVFSDNGASIPVTVIEVEPNRVSQIKTVETDGYVAIQVVIGTRRANRVTRPMAGHYKKAGVEDYANLYLTSTFRRGKAIQTVVRARTRSNGNGYQKCTYRRFKQISGNAYPIVETRKCVGGNFMPTNRIRVFTSCRPKNCSWGWTPVKTGLFSSVASYDQGFVKRKVTHGYVNGRFRLKIVSKYKSNRRQTTTRYAFYKLIEMTRPEPWWS